jgi:hypothetical protein
LRSSSSRGKAISATNSSRNCLLRPRKSRPPEFPSIRADSTQVVDPAIQVPERYEAFRQLRTEPTAYEWRTIERRTASSGRHYGNLDVILTMLPPR